MPELDYYKTLGVSKSASADELRKAYRKLARQNHPDAKPNDLAAAERFKQIQQAYDVLNDATKRQQYDRFGSDFSQAGRSGSGRSPFGGNAGFSGAGSVDLGDLFGQGVDFSSFFGGAASSGGGRKGKRTATRGEDLRATIEVSFQTAVQGGSVDVSLDRGGTTDVLSVKVSSGVISGQVVRLTGQGLPSSGEGSPGDLYLTIEVQTHAYFRREGSHLLIDVPITPSEAVLGTKVEVPTLLEGLVVLKIPPGTSSGVKLRLRGKGILDAQTQQTGDQIVIVKIVVPKEIGEDDKILYKQLAEREASPRVGVWPAS